MNSLSWFIYLTQVTDSVGGGAAIIGGLGIFAGVFFVMFLSFAVEDNNLTKDQAIGYGKTWFSVCFGLLLISAVMPSRQTMLMIAGSEMGERLVKSDGVTSIVNPGMDLIRKWIKQEADKIKEKS